jgi:hypothetical protein
MALFNETEEVAQPAPPPTVNPRIEPEVFRGITVDTEYTPSSALLTWVEGSNWTVDYFSQILGADSEPTPQALDRSVTYQSYRRVKGMHLKVTSPLGFSQDPTIRTMEVRGSGITYPFLVPNKGDMFVADIGDGRVGVFTVTLATRATILRDSVYNVEYVMVSELTNERLADLERKSLETYHYSHASLVSGCGPFVTAQELTRSDRYQTLFRQLVQRYLSDFFSPEHSTLLVPDQLKKTYDHFATKAVLQVLDSRLDQRIRRIRELNVTAEPVMSQPTFWDALVRLDTSLLYGATRQAFLLSTNHFKGRPTLQALGYTGIPRVVFPEDVSTDVDSQYDHDDSRVMTGIPFREGRPRRPLPGAPLTQAERNLRYFQPTPPLDGVDPWRLPPDLHPVAIDPYYVLSAAFYNEDKANQSKLEMLVWQALKREAMNLEQFDSLLEQVLDWDNLERFYYYPILFILLKRAGAR